MADLDAMELRAPALTSTLATSAFDEAWIFIGRAVTALAAVALGGLLVTVALTAGLVAAPLLALGLGAAAWRAGR